MRPKLRSQAMTESISPHRRITVDEYHDMARTGLIGPDARTELIEGEVVHVAPIGDRHGDAVEALDELLHQALAGLARVRCQMPVRLGEYSQPEPDLVVVRPRTGRNDRGHPSAADVFLIIEISVSTLRYHLDIPASEALRLTCRRFSAVRTRIAVSRMTRNRRHRAFL
jgi:Uma2 family endonuclease